jgi:hypothetical protein
MSTLDFDVFNGLRQGGMPEDKARDAAAAIYNDKRFDRLDRLGDRVTVLTISVAVLSGVSVPLLIAIFVRLFVHG